MDSTTLQVAVLGASAIMGAVSLGYYLGVGSKTKREKSNTIIPVNDLQDGRYSEDEKDARCGLASLYRAIDLLGWSEQIYNHISVSFIVTHKYPVACLIKLILEVKLNPQLSYSYQ